MEREIDGVRLDRLRPGSVREVSSSLATWLIVEGYAELEMRRVPRDSDIGTSGGSNGMVVGNDRRRRT